MHGSGAGKVRQAARDGATRASSVSLHQSKRPTARRQLRGTRTPDQPLRQRAAATRRRQGRAPVHSGRSGAGPVHSADRRAEQRQRGLAAVLRLWSRADTHAHGHRRGQGAADQRVPVSAQGGRHSRPTAGARAHSADRRRWRPDRRSRSPRSGDTDGAGHG